VRAGDLDAELRAIRRGGFAVQAGQVHDGLACAAIPVRTPAGALVAALVFTVHSTDPNAAAAHAGLAREATARLGPLLG
jgi:DNA-binding IclR family transcriptional regulator